jgi:hypothetical protein
MCFFKVLALEADTLIPGLVGQVLIYTVPLRIKQTQLAALKQDHATSL